MSILTGTRVLLGVTGGIAAYKSADLVRRLREAGAEVRVVMTPAATHFVGEATFQALSGHPVRSALFDPAAEAAMGHIELARWAQRVVVAPATADAIARLAAGFADDLLATLCLASEAPLLLAPAMNQRMWAHPATRENLARLTARGVALVGPGSGEQACGDVGEGRMAEPAQIVAALATHAASDRALAGERWLVTAGPTYEDLDPVRFLGNRSSGRMGFSIAAAAAERGADVVLVTGPTALPSPAQVQRIDVRSAAQMAEAVLREAASAHVLVSAAAVADFRPEAADAAKWKKDGRERVLRLVPTRDILAELASAPTRPFVVGFAAETDALEAHARAKLERKRMDLVCANWVGPDRGFDTEDNALLVLGTDGFRVELGRAAKPALARSLVELIRERRGR